MGINSSKVDCIAQISTEKPSYSSGDVLGGLVSIKVNNEFISKQLVLKIYGIEHAKYIDGDKSSQGDREIFQNQQVLQIWENQTAKKGEYTFPFSVQLPQDLPGSCEIKIGKSDGKISYYFQLTSQGLKSDDPSLSYTHQFYINQNMTAENFMAGNLMRYKTLFQCTQLCFGAGQTKLKCVIDKPYYYKGENIELTININNKHCSLPVQDVNITLLQSKIIKQIYQQEYAESKLVILNTTKKVNVEKNKKNKNYLHSINISNLNLPTTVQGNLVRIEYILVINLVYDGTFAFCNSEMHIPILLFSEQLKQGDPYYHNNYNLIENQQIENINYGQNNYQNNVVNNQYVEEHKYPNISNQFQENVPNYEHQKQGIIYGQDGKRQIQTIKYLDDAQQQMINHQPYCDHDDNSVQNSNKQSIYKENQQPNNKNMIKTNYNYPLLENELQQRNFQNATRQPLNY